MSQTSLFAYISDIGRGTLNLLFPLKEQTMHLVDISNQLPLQSATDRPTIACSLAKIASLVWLWLEVFKTKDIGYLGVDFGQMF